MRLTIINGSPRSAKISNTYNALMQYADKLVKDGKVDEVYYYKLPLGLKGCANCDVCNVECNIKDECQEIFDSIEKSEYVLFGSPVYLDMPTAQMVAFITRLNCKAENTKREFFRGKKASTLATSYCSGTKTVIHSLIGALEMLGFDIEGRSSREYIQLWNDKKIRGGMAYADSLFMGVEIKTERYGCIYRREE
jgi:multimeric flavodoxin WrbA